MGTSTVKVPEQYREAIFEAVLAELHHDANWVKSSVEEVQRWRLENREAAELARMMKEEEPEPKDTSPADIDGSFRCLRDIHALLADACAESETLAGEPSALAYVLAAAAEKVFGPQLSRALNYGPDDLDLGEVERLTEAIKWATGEAIRLNGERVMV